MKGRSCPYMTLNLPYNLKVSNGKHISSFQNSEGMKTHPCSYVVHSPTNALFIKLGKV
jgi:hypothetical protein